MVFKEVFCLAVVFVFVEGQSTCLGGLPSNDSLVGKQTLTNPTPGYSYLDSSTSGVFGSAGTVTKFEFYVDQVADITVQCWRPHTAPPDMLRIHFEKRSATAAGMFQIEVNWRVQQGDRCGFYFESETRVPIPYVQDQSHYSFEYLGTQAVNSFNEFQFSSGEAYKKFMFQYCFTSDGSSPPPATSPTTAPPTQGTTTCYGPDVTSTSHLGFPTTTTAPYSHVNNYATDVIKAAATIRVVKFYASALGTIKLQLFTPVRAPVEYTLKAEHPYQVTSLGVQTVNVVLNAAVNDRIGFTQMGTGSLVLPYTRLGDAYSSIQTDVTKFPAAVGATGTYNNPEQERFPFTFCTGQPATNPPTPPPTTRAPPTGSGWYGNDPAESYTQSGFAGPVAVMDTTLGAQLPAGWLTSFQFKASRVGVTVVLLVLKEKTGNQQREVKYKLDYSIPSIGVHTVPVGVRVEAGDRLGVAYAGSGSLPLYYQTASNFNTFYTNSLATVNSIAVGSTVNFDRTEQNAKLPLRALIQHPYLNEPLVRFPYGNVPQGMTFLINTPLPAGTLRAFVFYSVAAGATVRFHIFRPTATAHTFRLVDEFSYTTIFNGIVSVSRTFALQQGDLVGFSVDNGDVQVPISYSLFQSGNQVYEQYIGSGNRLNQAISFSSTRLRFEIFSLQVYLDTTTAPPTTPAPPTPPPTNPPPVTSPTTPSPETPVVPVVPSQDPAPSPSSEQPSVAPPTLPGGGVTTEGLPPTAEPPVSSDPTPASGTTRGPVLPGSENPVPTSSDPVTPDPVTTTASFRDESTPSVGSTARPPVTPPPSNPTTHPTPAPTTRPGDSGEQDASEQDEQDRTIMIVAIAVGIYVLLMILIGIGVCVGIKKRGPMKRGDKDKLRMHDDAENVDDVGFDNPMMASEVGRESRERPDGGSPMDTMEGGYYASVNGADARNSAISQEDDHPSVVYSDVNREGSVTRQHTSTIVEDAEPQMPPRNYEESEAQMAREGSVQYRDGSAVRVSASPARESYHSGSGSAGNRESYNDASITNRESYPEEPVDHRSRSGFSYTEGSMPRDSYRGSSAGRASYHEGSPVREVSPPPAMIIEEREATPDEDREASPYRESSPGARESYRGSPERETSPYRGTPEREVTPDRQSASPPPPPAPPVQEDTDTGLLHRSAYGARGEDQQQSVKDIRSRFAQLDADAQQSSQAPAGGGDRQTAMLDEMRAKFNGNFRPSPQPEMVIIEGN